MLLYRYRQFYVFVYSILDFFEYQYNIARYYYDQDYLNTV